MGDDEDNKDERNEHSAMILNNITSLTQDSEDDDEIESSLITPASIISQPSNEIIFHCKSTNENNKIIIKMQYFHLL